MLLLPVSCSLAFVRNYPRSSALILCGWSSSLAPRQIVADRGHRFQVSHQFAMGERLQPYTFAALYGSSKVGALRLRWGARIAAMVVDKFNV